MVNLVDEGIAKTETMSVDRWSVSVSVTTIDGSGVGNTIGGGMVGDRGSMSYSVGGVGGMVDSGGSMSYMVGSVVDSGCSMSYMVGSVVDSGGSMSHSMGGVVDSGGSMGYGMGSMVDSWDSMGNSVGGMVGDSWGIHGSMTVSWGVVGLGMDIVGSGGGKVGTESILIGIVFVDKGGTIGGNVGVRSSDCSIVSFLVLV